MKKDDTAVFSRGCVGGEKKTGKRERMKMGMKMRAECCARGRF